MRTHELIEVVLTTVAAIYACEWQQFIKPSAPLKYQEARGVAFTILCCYECDVMDKQLIGSVFGITANSVNSLYRRYNIKANTESVKFTAAWQVVNDLYKEAA